MRSMQQQLGVLGNISTFAFRHRETEKNLSRGGRSHELPCTDFQPAILLLKYVEQQYTNRKMKLGRMKRCGRMYYNHQKRNVRTNSETADLRSKKSKFCCDGKNITCRFVFLYTEYVFWYILPYVRLGHLSSLCTKPEWLPDISGNDLLQPKPLCPVAERIPVPISYLLTS